MKISKFHILKQIVQPKFFILPSLFFLVACNFKFIEELDYEFLDFQPKLSVTAILNGGSGIFDIRLMEGVSLSGYNDRDFNKTNILNGEIRLYENDVQILSIPGPFDMSQNITDTGDMWKWGRNGYRWVSSGITTRPGSVYHLEVEVEGYPMAVSTSVMPAMPVVSASMDTLVQVIRKNIVEIGSAGYSLQQMGGFENDHYPDRYWPLSVSVDVLRTNNYLALDIIKFNGTQGKFWGIGAIDGSILLENGMTLELIPSNENVDLYLFPMLITKEFKGASRKFYAAVAEITNNTEYDDAYLDEHPDIDKITTQNSLTLRVRNITSATYLYYCRLSSQFSDGILADQPTTVVGNIENGYGSFAVYNTANIPLLEWETYEYKEKK